MNLTPDQEHATSIFLDFLLSDESELVISGPSGSGKSTLVNHLIKSLRADSQMMDLLFNGKFKKDLVLTATTNKAAKVLADKTSCPTSTIHSFLNLIVTNNFKTGRTTLKQSDTYVVHNQIILFIDEAFMVDTNLYKKIKESTLNCKVVYIGDSHQLPPVFERGSPINKIKNRVDLTTIKRQLADSPILTLGDSFRQGISSNIFPNIEPNNPSIICVDDSEYQQLLNAAFSSEYKEDHYKILTWTNETANAYNAHIRELHSLPKELTKGEYLVANTPVFKGQRIKIKSDTLIRIDTATPHTVENIDGTLISCLGVSNLFVPLDFKNVSNLLKHYTKAKDWAKYFAAKEYFADLRPVHASTVHKAQGSTYHTVFIDLPDIGTNNKMYEVLRLLYVAITRASDKVIFRGKLPLKYRNM